MSATISENGLLKLPGGNCAWIRRVLDVMVHTASRCPDMRGLVGRSVAPVAELPGVGPLVASGMVAAVVAIHALFGFNPAMEALYLVPVWFAFRWGGATSGFAVSGFAAVTASLVNVERLTLLSLVLRLAAYSAFAMVCLRTEPRFSARLEAGCESGPSESEPAVAVLIDCEGFEELDAVYGQRTGKHVEEILLRVLENETRSSDMIARTGHREYAVVLAGINAVEAKGLMARVQERFEQFVDDAGYECSIDFGCEPVVEEPRRIQDLICQTQPNWRQAYLN